jgi:hypothetical protein
MTHAQAQSDVQSGFAESLSFLSGCDKFAGCQSNLVQHHQFLGRVTLTVLSRHWLKIKNHA